MLPAAATAQILKVLQSIDPACTFAQLNLVTPSGISVIELRSFTLPTPVSARASRSPSPLTSAPAPGGPFPRLWTGKAG